MPRPTIHLPRIAGPQPDPATPADPPEPAAPISRDRPTLQWPRYGLGLGDDLQSVYDLTDDEDGPRETSDAAGHCVMGRSALKQEIESSGFDGDYDALSSGEEQRVRFLRQLINKPLYRRHLVADAALLARVEALDADAPTFATVTRLVRDAAHVSMIGGAPIRIPPILMVGPAGIGKSRFAHSLSETLGTLVENVSGSTLSDSLALTGHDTSWRGSGMGRVARALLASSTSAPLIFVDECEKVVDWNNKPHPLDVLLPLLEPHTACTFRDDYLKIAMRAEHALWLLACNTLDGLSAPLVDRLIVVPVEGLRAGGRTQVLTKMFAEASQAVAIPMQLADEAVLGPVRGLSLRKARQAFEIAIARAVAADRRVVTRDDLAAAATLLGRTSEPRGSMGFLPRHEHVGE